MDDPPTTGEDPGAGAVTEESFEIDPSLIVDYPGDPALDPSLDQPMDSDEAAYEHDEMPEGAEDPFMTSPEALNALAAAVLAQNEAAGNEGIMDQDLYANGESSANQDWTEEEPIPPSTLYDDAEPSELIESRVSPDETNGLPPYTAPSNVIYPTDSKPNPYVGSMDLQPHFSNIPSNSLFRPAYLPGDVDPRVDQRSVWMGIDRASRESPNTRMRSPCVLTICSESGLLPAANV